MVATVALFLALGGGAYAATQLKRNSVGTRQLRARSVTHAKLAPGAIDDVDVRPRSVSGASIDASTFDGVSRAARADLAASVAAPEPRHLVGGPGEVPFGAGWSNEDTERPVAFYLDREGIVHLQGVARGVQSAPVVFELPPSLVPKARQLFSTGQQAGKPGEVDVLPSGAVLFVAGDAGSVFLNGITWRAGQ